MDPCPPRTIRADDQDLAALHALVAKLGYEEVIYHLTVRLLEDAGRATGPEKGATEAGANVMSRWGPSFHWCDPRSYDGLAGGGSARVASAPEGPAP